MTRRQELFIKEYMECNNASEACRRVGYSVKTANRMANQNLSKPYIKAEIDRLIKERNAHYQLTKPEFIRKTIELHDSTTQPSVKARYWELLSKMYGFTSDQPVQQVAVYSGLNDIIHKRIQNKDLQAQGQTT